MQLLGQVQQQLCKPLSSSAPRPEAPAADANVNDWLKAKAARGWKLMDCHSGYYLTLQHPLLHMQLDIQVIAELVALCAVRSSVGGLHLATTYA
jgi:hypothetical protein